MKRQVIVISPGDRHWLLTAVEPVDGGRFWLWQCDCGVHVSRRKSKVVGGAVKSCGCLRRKMRSENNSDNRESDGKSRTPEYKAWANMLDRCYRPNCISYENYGGRGIMVCDRWQSFANFLADMGHRPSPTHSIDRIDTNGNYEPSNCRWVTIDIQSRNKRSSVRIEYRGETKTVSEWARELGLKKHTVYNRLRRGMDIAAALTLTDR